MAAALIAFASLASTHTARAADATKGQQLYQARCATCHTADENDVGPAHRGVFGRPVASAAGFEYSEALKKRAGEVWGEVTLNAWLTAPERFAPGQAMGVSVPEPEARADLIAYLRTLTTAAAH